MRSIKVLTLNNIRLHKYLVLLGLTSLFLYGGFIGYVMIYDYKDPANALQFSSFLIQSGMLFFTLLGYRLSTKNLTKSMYQIANEKMIKLHLINIAFMFVLSFLFVLLFIGVTNTYYYVTGNATAFSIESSLFFLYYWMLPFVISGLLGYIFGMNFTSKLVYIIIFIVWTFLSPTNLGFLGNLLANSQFPEGEKFLRNINLGVHKIDEMYHPLFGFEFDWYKKLALLIALIFITFLSIYLNKFKASKKIMILSVFILLGCYSLIPYNYAKSELQDINNLLKEFNDYNNPGELPPLKYFDYKIKQMNVVVKDTKSLHVTTKVDITDIKNSILAFTLSSGFKVSNITLKNGESLKFKQNGDYTFFQLPELNKNNSETLIIDYSGDGTIRNPSINNVNYLPYHFIWTPTNKRTITHFIFDHAVTATEVKDLPNVKYNLTIKGNEQYYTNLEYKGNNRYAGEAQGITLISGKLTSRVKDKNEIVFPTSWFPYEKELDDYLSEYKKGLQKYNDLLKTNYKMPNRIIILPIMEPLISSINLNSFEDQSNLVLQIEPSDFINTISINDGIPFQIDNAFNRIEIQSEKQKENWLIFNSFLGYQISDKTSEKENVFQFFMYSVGVNLTKEKQEILELLVEKKGKLTDEFSILWRNILLDSNQNDWKQLENLISIHEKGDFH